MARQTAVRGILTGMGLAAQAKRDGIQILGVGEMGIGNTTTSSAVLCALSGKPVEAVTGRGGGLTDAAFLKKKQVIEQALAINTPDGNDPVDVLHKVGGFDLCAMAGVFLGAAHERLPVVVDGFISSSPRSALPGCVGPQRAISSARTCPMSAGTRSQPGCSA